MSLTEQERKILRKCFVEINRVSNKNFKAVVKECERLDSNIKALAGATKSMYVFHIEGLKKQLEILEEKEKKK